MGDWHRDMTDWIMRRVPAEQVGVELRRLNAAERELYEERAAIREYDGRQTRAQAEQGALADVLHIRRRVAPHDCSICRRPDCTTEHACE